MKFPGVISFLNERPICPIPIGNFLLVVLWTFLKFTNIPCAVSGLKYTSDFASSVTPINVLNIKLNLRISVKSSFPQFGHGIWFSLIYETNSSLLHPSSPEMSLPFLKPHSSINLSALCLVLQALQSISGSLNPPIWPVVTHTSGFIIIAASIPTLYFDSFMNFLHHISLIFFFNSAPNGP